LAGHVCDPEVGSIFSWETRVSRPGIQARNCMKITRVYKNVGQTL
jgi:hypothetical protein